MNVSEISDIMRKLPFVYKLIYLFMIMGDQVRPSVPVSSESGNHSDERQTINSPSIGLWF